MSLTSERKREIKEMFDKMKEPILIKYRLNRPDKAITPLEYLEKVKATKEIALIMPLEELSEDETIYFLNCKTEFINNLIKIG